MKVFISWSGERSKRVGELLDGWIQCVIQAVDPWMSSKDIDRGSLWFTEISDTLSTTSVGIVCLTVENKDRPWILFEAGALAKGLSSSRVITFLIDLMPPDITDPLAQFNHALPNKEGLWQLVRTINGTLKEKALKEKVLESVFETYWPQFESTFKLILKQTPIEHKGAPREKEDVLNEVLSVVRTMDRRLRDVEVNRSQSRSSTPLSQDLQIGDRDYYSQLIRTELINGATDEEMRLKLRNLAAHGIYQERDRKPSKNKADPLNSEPDID